VAARLALKSRAVRVAIGVGAGDARGLCSLVFAGAAVPATAALVTQRPSVKR
jgi:hypothetical protein